MQIYAERYKCKTGQKRDEFRQNDLTLEDACQLAVELESEYDRVMIINDAPMSDELYVVALQRMSERIEAGLTLVFWDDTIVGDKDTHCSWGLCSRDPKQWPDPLYHTWPLEYLEQGRISRVSRQPHQFCPFDDKNQLREYDHAGTGCFWRCSIFQERFRPSADDAILLYENMIKVTSHTTAKDLSKSKNCSNTDRTPEE